MTPSVGSAIFHAASYVCFGVATTSLIAIIGFSFSGLDPMKPLIVALLSLLCGVLLRVVSDHLWWKTVKEILDE